VVAAAQRLRAQAVALRERARAMAAHVVEHAHDLVRAAHRDHRQAGEVADHVVARVAQLAHVRQQLPTAIKDQRAIHRGVRRIGVETRGQGGGVVQRLRVEVRRRLRDGGAGGGVGHTAEYATGTDAGARAAA
jgi:hypothetical protein